jgi:hypothetical protein
MNQLMLKDVSRDIIDRAEESLVLEQGLPQVVDDYFVERMKQDEMQSAFMDAKPYERLRAVVKAKVLPLYEQYLGISRRLREKKQNRKLSYYVLGTIAVLQTLEAILTKGRSFVPALLIPSAILHGFIGFILYSAAQYIDELQLARARKRLEKSIAGLDHGLLTDIEYDNRRMMTDADVLRAEAVELLVQYEQPEVFWRDYVAVREADPTIPVELKKLEAPAFEKFLKGHFEGQYTPAARQHRFNRLFLEAQEIFINRDREGYVPRHLKNRTKEIL